MGDWVVLFGKNLFSRLTVIKSHYALDCNRLLFFGCTFKAMCNSM